MAIKNGMGTIKRRHSKNYISAEADARLKEAVRPYQEQGKRALEVDSFVVKYYHQERSTTTCTCKQTRILAAHSQLGTNLPATVIKQESVLGTSMQINFKRQLFGTQSDSIQSDDGDIDPDEDMDIAEDDDDDRPQQDALFSAHADCGICYKTGYVPGYHAYGYDRKLFTTHNIAHVAGYTIDVSVAPHVISRVDTKSGYLEFDLEVPKYFKDIHVSVRNNREVLPDTIYNDLDQPLTFAEVKQSAGRTIKIRVHALELTHLVVEFDLGTDKVLANLAQQQKTIDWTLFSTLGNIQIILPMTINNVAASDVVYVPSRHTSFKITDVTYLTTSKDKNLDWSVSTRVLQPQEALGRIYRAYRLA